MQGEFFLACTPFCFKCKSMNRQTLARIIGINLVIDTIIFDQLSKWWVITSLYKAESHNPDLLTWLFSKAPRFNHPSEEITSFFNMVMVWNKGVSFGLFNNPDGLSVTILSMISLLIAGGFFIWMMTLKRIFPAIGIGLIIGGAVGNVWDRLRFGAVADFFDFHYNGFHWPAFNIADAAIVIGVTILIIDSIFFDRQNHRNSA